MDLNAIQLEKCLSCQKIRDLARAARCPCEARTASPKARLAREELADELLKAYGLEK